MSELETLAILLIPIFLIKYLIEIHINFFRKNMETCFVMINDPDCYCNMNNFRRTLNCTSEYCVSKLLLKIVSKIEEATKSIDIAVFTFTNEELAHQIIKAHERGIAVRVIVDKSVYEKRSSHSQISQLINAGKLMYHVFDAPTKV